jgi:hypothetical protein
VVRIFRWDSLGIIDELIFVIHLMMLKLFGRIKDGLSLKNLSLC